MTYSPYKKALTTLSPVAVKSDQAEVHAPGHKHWGTVTCDDCGAKFNIGPSLIYGSRRSEMEYVEMLENQLADDHKFSRQHQNSYEFPE